MIRIFIICIIFAVTFITGCDGANNVKVRRSLYCYGDKRAEFVINCAKAANPMSDEEGEDLVSQCERTAKKMVDEDYCVSRYEWYKSDRSSWFPCYDAPIGSNKMSACKKHGWKREKDESLLRESN